MSAQSCTEITLFLPGSAGASITGRRVKIRLPRRGQYSPAVDTLGGAAASSPVWAVAPPRFPFAASGDDWRRIAPDISGRPPSEWGLVRCRGRGGRQGTVLTGLRRAVLPYLP